MEAPTPHEIREWAPPLFPWADYGLAAPETGTDLLASRIESAVGTLYAVTGRRLASIPAAEAPEELAIARKVLVAFCMTEAAAGGTAALKVAAQPWIKSITAGSFSQTRFSPSEMAGGRSGDKEPPYPPALWWLLWALMAPAKQAWWTEHLSGRVAAATAVVTPGWAFDDDCDPLEFA